MIALALGPTEEIRLFFSYGKTTRIRFGVVRHVLPNARRQCFTTVWFVPNRHEAPVVVFEDTPDGFESGTFRCPVCRQMMEIRRSGLHYLPATSSSYKAKRRGLRVVV